MAADLKTAMDAASGPKTPWNPSRSAIARVLDPLPAPTTCPHCNSRVELVNNEIVYGRPYGDWPWMFLCTAAACRAYVGLHPFTDIPLGTLADKRTREARQRAKAAFNPLWSSATHKRRDARSKAYAWLARQLGIKMRECHIGWFDVATCERVVEACAKGRP